MRQSQATAPWIQWALVVVDKVAKQATSSICASVWPALKSNGSARKPLVSTITPDGTRLGLSLKSPTAPKRIHA